MIAMMSTSFANVPSFSLRPPLAAAGSHTHHRFLEVDGRRVPSFEVRLTEKRYAPLLEWFPLTLHPIRSAYLTPATRSKLKIPAETDMVIEAMMPELYGSTPLAHWMLTTEQVIELARANASSGALLVNITRKRRGSETARIVYAPFWLDWQGWTGFASHLNDVAAPLADSSLRYLAYELEQRSADPPSGIHTARAQLLNSLGDAAGAAAACQDEIALNLNHEGLPARGALMAISLLGQLLVQHNEHEEAHAALSLALWLSPNHREAHSAILPLLSGEDAVVDSLARLSRMPQRPRNFAALLEDSARRLGMRGSELETKVDLHGKARGDALFGEKPAWITQGSARDWLETIGF